MSSVYAPINTTTVQGFFETIMLERNLTPFETKGAISFCQEDCYLIEQLFCVNPSQLITEFSRTTIIRELLDAEYGKDVLDEVSRPF